jgi:hypothetical protein
LKAKYSSGNELGGNENTTVRVNGTEAYFRVVCEKSGR